MTLKHRLKRLEVQLAPEPPVLIIDLDGQAYCRGERVDAEAWHREQPTTNDGGIQVIDFRPPMDTPCSADNPMQSTERRD